jgi:glycosyltransferase involved in cell wall biosynthesis
VHAHGLRAGLVAALAVGARPWPGRGVPGARPPLVVTWHNLLMDGRGGARAAVLRAAERLVARSADVTLCASDDLVGRAWRLGGTDVRLAPVAAPVLPVTRTPEQVRTGLGVGGRPLVLAVGRLHPQKRLDVLIDAAARLSGQPGQRREDGGPGGPVVVVAGTGPDEAALRARAAGGPVRFLGHRTDVGDLLAACDVAVVTSDWEARQLFAQEALRAGKPLVATAVGGLPGLVGDGALLVPPGDPDAVAAALHGLLTDPAAAGALAARGAAVAAGWPDEAATAGLVLALYTELTGPPAAAEPGSSNE